MAHPQPNVFNPSLAEEGIVATLPVTADQAEILSPDALRFVADLARRFRATRDELLMLRVIRQREIDAGRFPDFLQDTAAIRRDSWTVAPIPEDLRDRRVEITGQVDARTVVSALSSGAWTFVADFEDFNSPTWYNCVEGQVNLLRAVERTLDLTGADEHASTTTLMVRPRGWHLEERHLRVDGEPIPATLFDFGLYVYHNAATLIEQGTAPYFYLPKIESHLEARLWNDVFEHAQSALGIPSGTIRATVLIETILAAFEMDEILYELRDHAAGLNCGRYDYIFSFIKRFRNHPAYVFPDRANISPGSHFLASYAALLVQTCHRRGVHAMGGLSAQFPILGDPRANQDVLRKVRAEKLREVRAGFDGTSVAHPDLVPVAREIFDEAMPTPNQIDRLCDDARVTAEDLLTIPSGSITLEGLRSNIDVGILYLESWLEGMWSVRVLNVMQDAATAEIARAQVWQWIHHGARLDDGRIVTAELVRSTVQEALMSMAETRSGRGISDRGFFAASKLFTELATGDTFSEFMPLVAYDYLV